MVDLDGTFKYSKLVSVILDNDESSLNHSGIEKIYPNPVKGNVSVLFNVAEEQENYTYTLFNAFGQVIKNESLTLTEGQHTIELDAAQYAAGVYFISFTQQGKGISYEGKFIKLEN